MTIEKDNLILDEMSERIVDVAEKLVTAKGAHNVTVRNILQKLGVTNRVFYNRFHNIGEVLEAVYKKTILKIRESVASGFDKNRDFFEQVIDIVEKTLLLSYDSKMKFNHFVFENDSISTSNYEWWRNEIKKIVEYAKVNNHIKNDVDSDIMSYSIWCFIRGYNADVVARNIPKQDAVKNFRYCFSYLLEGMRK